MTAMGREPLGAEAVEGRDLALAIAPSLDFGELERECLLSLATVWAGRFVPSRAAVHRPPNLEDGAVRCGGPLRDSRCRVACARPSDDTPHAGME